MTRSLDAYFGEHFSITVTHNIKFEKVETIRVQIGRALWERIETGKAQTGRASGEWVQTGVGCFGLHPVATGCVLLQLAFEEQPQIMRIALV